MHEYSEEFHQEFPESRFPCWQFHLVLWSLFIAIGLTFIAGFGPAAFLAPIISIDSPDLEANVVHVNDQDVVVKHVEIGTWCTDFAIKETGNTYSRQHDCGILWPNLKQVIEPVCQGSKSSASSLGSSLKSFGFCNPHDHAQIPVEVSIAQAMSILYLFFILMAFMGALLPLACCGKDMFVTRQRSLRNFGIATLTWATVVAIACTALSVVWLLGSQGSETQQSENASSLHVMVTTTPIIRTGVAAVLLSVLGVIGFVCFPVLYPTYESEILEGDRPKGGWEGQAPYQEDGTRNGFSKRTPTTQDATPILVRSRVDRGHYVAMP